MSRFRGKNKNNEKDVKTRHKKKYKDAFKLSQAYIKFFNDFNDQIKTIGLQLRDVGGDGNCLFRNISDQIEGQQDMHMMYRKEACQHMKQNQEFYTLYLDQDEDGNLKDYLEEMMIDGQWGGNLELQALSECLNMNIVIHRKQLEQTIVEPCNVKKDKNQKRFTIHLAYFQQQDFEHYTSVRVKGDESSTQAITSLSKIPKYRYLDIVKDLSDSDQEYPNKNSKSNKDFLNQQQPYPNYPKNKKCKCQSGLAYKNCCLKQYQKRKYKKRS